MHNISLVFYTMWVCLTEVTVRMAPTFMKREPLAEVMSIGPTVLLSANT